MFRKIIVLGHHGLETEAEVADIDLVVAHKRADRYSNENSIEKRTIGKFWTARSHGHCLFVMTCGKNFHVITDAVR